MADLGIPRNTIEVRLLGLHPKPAAGQQIDVRPGLGMLYHVACYDYGEIEARNWNKEKR